MKRGQRDIEESAAILDLNRKNVEITIFNYNELN
jgi:hypothetical protein